LGDIPAFLDYPINFYFNAGGAAAPDRGASWFHTASKVPLASSNGRAPGHSPGMVAHLVASGDKQFLISADVVNLAPHISTNPEWQLAIDQDPQMAVETRRKIFDRAVADKLTISGTCRLAGQGWQQLRIRSRRVIVARVSPSFPRRAPDVLADTPRSTL